MSVSIQLEVPEKTAVFIAETNTEHLYQCFELLPVISNMLKTNLTLSVDNEFVSKKMEKTLNEEINRLNAKHAHELSQMEGRLKESRQLEQAADARASQKFDTFRSDLLALMAKKDTQIEELTGVLRGSNTRTGVVGETQVATVFDTLGLGYLENTTQTSQLGAEDFVFSFFDPTIKRDLKINVEVKKCSQTIKREVMAKHEKRTQEAHALGRIDGSIFFSLDCRIPCKSVVDFSLELGPPVLYISRSEEFTAAGLIEFGFVAAKKLFPLLIQAQQQEVETVESVESQSQQQEQQNKNIRVQQVQHFIRIFKEQIESFVSLNSEISTLEKFSQSQTRSIERLKVIKQGMIDRLLTLENAYPDAFITHSLENDTQHLSEQSNIPQTPQIDPMKCDLIGLCSDLNETQQMIVRKITCDKMKNPEKRWEKCGSVFFTAREKVEYEAQKKELTSTAQAQLKHLKKIAPSACAAEKKSMKIPQSSQ